jgi:hypothetical protein
LAGLLLITIPLRVAEARGFGPAALPPDGTRCRKADRADQPPAAAEHKIAGTVDGNVLTAVFQRQDRGFWPFREDQRAQVERLVQPVEAARQAA